MSSEPRLFGKAPSQSVRNSCRVSVFMFCRYKKTPLFRSGSQHYTTDSHRFGSRRKFSFYVEKRQNTYLSIDGYAIAVAPEFHGVAGFESRLFSPIFEGLI